MSIIDELNIVQESCNQTNFEIINNAIMEIKTLQTELNVYKQTDYLPLQIQEKVNKMGFSIIGAIEELQRIKQGQTKESCNFCEQLDENNIECCIAGEDFIEPIFCPMCGKKL